ncbi:MAG: protein translocase subunit SecF [bacterium]|nr:protein translocase subunit SecF [bacterium]
MIRVIRHSKIWFIFSGILVAASVVLLLTWGLKPGIDFTGGSLFELEFSEGISQSELTALLQENGYHNVVVQPSTDKVVLVKTAVLDEAMTGKFKEIVTQKFGLYKELRFDSVGPTISSELVRKAYWQIALVVVGILLYIAYAFRNTGKLAQKFGISSWRMGLAAIVALIHDLLITVGLFVILGKFRGVEVDGLFVTALLTILGFSIHDTIVVFDRIRESLQKHPYKDLDVIMDYSVASTMARSINTSSTLVFVLVAMLLFGGQTIFNFVLALLVGVIVGTYSSIFIATPLLYLWSKSGQTK